MLDRLYIKDLQKELPYKDRRTVLRWCRNNGVGVFSDVGSNWSYVLKEEFEAVKMKQTNDYIKEKYVADKLSEVFISKMILYNNKNFERINKNNAYQPRGEYEEKFLNYLQNF
jgi:hypothetical protein